MDIDSDLISLNGFRASRNLDGHKSTNTISTGLKTPNMTVNINKSVISHISSDDPVNRGGSMIDALKTNKQSTTDDPNDFEFENALVEESTDIVKKSL